MTELSNELVCIQIRTGIELWVEKQRIDNLMNSIDDLAGRKFILIDDQLINVADIVGIFNPKTMEDHKRRKNGEWQCGKGSWHKAKQQCDCRNSVNVCGMCHVSPCCCRN